MARAWKRLGFEQRVAGVGAALLIVSTFGPFSLVEAAVVLIGVAVLWLLKQRSEGRDFHLPFGDGTVILAAGLWAGVLIAVRLLDRSLGQSVLALGCAAILAGAGARERAKRPPDDVPGPRPRDDLPRVELAGRQPRSGPAEAPTAWLEEDDVRTARLDEESPSPEPAVTRPSVERPAPDEERPRTD
jgi:hypothetical protein